MTSNANTKEMTATMDKLSLSGNSKYLPPHLKYGSAPRPPPPTPAISSMKDDTNQITSTKSQKEEGATISEQEKEVKPVSTMDSKKNYPHRKYAAEKAITKPAPSVKEEDATPAKGSDVVDSWEEEASDLEPEQSKSEPEHVASIKSEDVTKPIDNSPKLASSSQDSAPISNTKVPIDLSKAPHHRYAKTPAAPPPTPSSPSITSWSSRPSPARTSTPPERRPEKTMAVANRLIAGALGVKAPRRTEEQRNYDKAVRDQERKRRDAERDAKKKADEDAARAKAAIWDD